MTLLSGNPGDGKTFVCVDVCCSLATGTPFADGAGCVAGDSLIFTNEESPIYGLHPRVRLQGGDPSRIHYATETWDDGDDTTSEPFSIYRDVAVLEKYVDANPNIRLIVLDPLSDYITGIKSNSEDEVRAALGAVLDFPNASEYRTHRDQAREKEQ